METAETVERRIKSVQGRKPGMGGKGGEGDGGGVIAKRG